MVANTRSFEQLEVTISMRNIRTVYTKCRPHAGVGKMLLLTQSAPMHMARGQCKPFCNGIQACAVTKTQPGTKNQTEQHTFLCRCPDGTCADLALLLSEGTAVDPTLPMEICDIRTKRVKMHDAEDGRNSQQNPF